jgi:excisionase family DNA binding protein
MLNRGKMEIDCLPDLLTVRELAQVIRKRPEAILRGIKAKQIAAVLVGGTWRIPRAYVLELHDRAMRNVEA